MSEIAQPLIEPEWRSCCLYKYATRQIFATTIIMQKILSLFFIGAAFAQECLQKYTMGKEIKGRLTQLSITLNMEVTELRRQRRCG